jgi:hypothetical protein
MCAKTVFVYVGTYEKLFLDFSDEELREMKPEPTWRSNIVRRRNLPEYLDLPDIYSDPAPAEYGIRPVLCVWPFEPVGFRLRRMPCSGSSHSARIENNKITRGECFYQYAVNPTE